MPAAVGQFDGVTEFHYPYFVAVFLAEKCHRTHRPGLIDRAVATLFKRTSLPDSGIDDMFDLADLLLSELLEM